MVQIIEILTFWLASVFVQAWFIRRWHRFALQWIIVNIIALSVGLFVVEFVTFATLVAIFGPPLQTTDWPKYALPLGDLFALLMLWAILTRVQWLILRQKFTSARWWAAGNNAVQLIAFFLVVQSKFYFFSNQILSIEMLVIYAISGIFLGAITGITIKKF